MHYIVGNSVSEVFLKSCEITLANGCLCQPRGKLTKEIFPVVIHLNNPRERFLWVEGRILNPAFAVAEAIWILSGSQESWIYDFNKRLTNFTNNGILKAAYGPRIRKWNGMLDQLDYVRKKLFNDPESRQAVIQIWDPAIDTNSHRDIACTLNLRFLIRDNKLIMFSTMRSQDVWWGLPYDLFSFTMIQELMAGWLNISIGSFYHVVDSFHLYEPFFDKAQLVRSSNFPLCSQKSEYVITWKELNNTLSLVLEGKSVKNKNWTEIGWIMESYRQWKLGNKKTALSYADKCDGWGKEALKRWYQHLSSEKNKRLIN